MTFTPRDPTTCKSMSQVSNETYAGSGGTSSPRPVPTTVVSPSSSTVVSRYTQPSSGPVSATSAPAPASTTGPTLEPVDENAIRENARKGMQASIDAINANYADLV